LSEQLKYRPLEEYSPSYRSNTRVITDQIELAQQITERIKSIIPTSIDFKDTTWRLVGLNERFRFCKYIKGQHFSPHADAYFEKNSKERSFLTFMIYLSSDFEGGETCFLRSREPASPENTTFCLKPKIGSVLVFQHNIYHEGQMLKSGTKYIMRSDLMFKME